MLMYVRNYKINPDHITIELPCMTIIVNRTDIKETGSTEEMLSSKYDLIIKAVVDSYTGQVAFDFAVLGRGL